MRTRNKIILITVFPFLRIYDFYHYKIKEMVLLGLYMSYFRFKVILPERFVEQEP